MQTLFAVQHIDGGVILEITDRNELIASDPHHGEIIRLHVADYATVVANIEADWLD